MKVHSWEERAALPGIPGAAAVHPIKMAKIVEHLGVAFSSA